MGRPWCKGESAASRPAVKPRGRVTLARHCTLKGGRERPHTRARISRDPRATQHPSPTRCTPRNWAPPPRPEKHRCAFGRFRPIIGVQKATLKTGPQAHFGRAIHSTERPQPYRSTKDSPAARCAVGRECRWLRSSPRKQLHERVAFPAEQFSAQPAAGLGGATNGAARANCCRPRLPLHRHLQA